MVDVCVCVCVCVCVQVGQRHGGFTGVIQSACSLAQRHIWFERKVAADRRMVAKRSVCLCVFEHKTATSMQ